MADLASGTHPGFADDGRIEVTDPATTDSIAEVADGTPADACGNGTRCIASLLMTEKSAEKSENGLHFQFYLVKIRTFI